MPSGEESSTSVWRFSMELLSHVHALRVFLLPCSSRVQPARDCANVETALLSAPPGLSCSWKVSHEAAPHSIRLPLPVLLFDYSSSPRIAVLTDCIQLSLHLLPLPLPLPPVHLHALSSLSLSCSGPAGFPGVSRAAIHGECAVLDGAQCEDDNRQWGHEMNGSEDHASQGTAIFVCKKCLAKVSRKPVRSFVQLPCFDWREVAENWFGACCCSFGSTAEFLSVGFERSLQLRPGKCLVGPSTFYVDFSDVIVVAESGLLSNERDMRQFPTPRFLALGDGFMVWENQQSKIFEWLPLCCTNCASLIGAYPCTSTDSGSSREGLHLFQCEVITYNTDGTLYDAYRYKTFKDLLVKEIRQRTDENTSYRFLIRSLRSELPLLQLVVINYDSLTCTGRVNADVAEDSQCFSRITGSHRGAGLQQSIKVLFLDCTRLAGDDVRSAELWVKEHDAETVFMLEEFVDKLRDELLANSMFCPAECGLFQSFMGSFLYTTQD